MKLHSLSLAVGGAIAAMSASGAYALSLSDLVTNSSQYVQVHISGSSAVDPILARVVSKECVDTSSNGTGSTIDQYSYSNEYLITCTLTTAGKAGLASGITKLALFKESSNGSVNGTIAVAKGQTRPYIDASSLNSAGSCALASPASYGGGTLNLVPLTNIYACSSNTTVDNLIPDAGISDLEPAIFDTTSDSILSNAGTEHFPVVQVFGVPVSIILRDALQAHEGLTVGSDTEANMPSLSKDAINSLYTGFITTWSGLGLTSSDWSAAFAAYSGETAPSGGFDDNVYIARRTDQVDATGSLPNSGTQSSAEVFFTGQLCNAANYPFLFYNQGTDASGNAIINKSDCGGGVNQPPSLGNVFGGSGGSNVATCLTTHDSGGRGAIGLLGVADQPLTFSSSARRFRFIKVDGYAPTLYNVVNGLYHDWVESSYNTNPNTGAHAGAGGANAKTFATNQLLAEFADTAPIEDADSTLTNNSNSISDLPAIGALLNANNYVTNVSSTSPLTLPITPAKVLAAPVNTFEHQSGGTPNNCNPPLDVFPINLTQSGQ